MTRSASHDVRYQCGGAHRWRVLAVGTAAQAATSAYFQGLTTISPALRSAFGLDLAGLGILLAAPTAGLALTLLLWGRASDRYGDRGVMTLGLLGAAGSLAAASATSGATTAALLLLLAGASGASVNAASGRAVLAWFPPHQRGTAMGVRQTASPLGGLLAALVLPAVVAAAGLDAALLVLATGCLAAALAVAAQVREPLPDGRPAAAGAASSAPPGSVLRDHGLWRLTAASTLLVVPQFTVVAFTVELLHERCHVEAATAALVLGVVQAAGAAGRLVVGRWSDRASSRVGPLRALAVGMAAGAVVLGLSVSAPLPVLVSVLVVEGALVICWNGLAYTAAGELAPPAQRGTALAFQNTGNFLAASATPPVAGLLVQSAGYGPALALLAAPAAAAARLLRQVPERRSD